MCPQVGGYGEALDGVAEHADTEEAVTRSVLARRCLEEAFQRGGVRRNSKGFHLAPGALTPETTWLL